MNRTLAHLIGWASLAIGAALVALVMLVSPWLELHYAQWERGWMQACARSQQEQVEAYEHFASALASNDPVLLQRLAYHHLRLKPSRAQIVSLPGGEIGLAGTNLTSGNEAVEAIPLARAGDSRSGLVEQWLHKAYPVIGLDYPAYEAPDHMAIRLATGPKRIILLALGGLFLLCGLLLPGPAPFVPATLARNEDDEFVHAEIDEDPPRDDTSNDSNDNRPPLFAQAT